MAFDATYLADTHSWNGPRSSPARRANPVEFSCKRALDIFGALLTGLLALPVLAVAALLIRFTSPGPVIFRQVRCGERGREFEILKLRTMMNGSEQRRADLEAENEMDGPVFKIRRDPRITPVGRWLRRLSVDELPQLWNVLRGEMSLVGPRPPLPCEVAQYQRRHRRRLEVRPGLTCTWQISGRSEIGFEEWVRLDIEYIDGWHLGRDLRILLRTAPAILSRRGAY